MDLPATKAAPSPATTLGVAFLGAANFELFGTALQRETVRPLRLQPAPPTPQDMPSGEVRPFEPLRQEDAERALDGASAIVLGLPVPIPPATVSQGQMRDAQSFVVDGIMAAAKSRGIHHVALVAPDSKRAETQDPQTLDELGRIVRSYGMDVLDIHRRETTVEPETVTRWLDRCARVTRQFPAPAQRPAQPRRLPPRRTVRSVQRLALPRGWDAERVARAYPTFLATSFPWILDTQIDQDGSFRVVSPLAPRPLLDLHRQPRLDGPRRRVFHVRGGALAGETAGREGWLEFRVLPGGKEIIAVVADFVPKLPWVLYRVTQAPAHEIIMRGFAQYLAREANHNQ